jgi:hypothetical protein
MEDDKLSNWQDMWDQAQKTDDFQNEKIDFPSSQVDVGSNDTAQDYYWNNLEAEALNDGLLTEEKTPNPVYPDSVGKDQDKPEPSWVKENLLDEVKKLKQKLYDLEIKMNEKDGGSGEVVEKCHHPETDKMFKKIKDMEQKIDKLSNQLGKEDEPSVSQWETGDDEK